MSIAIAVSMLSSIPCLSWTIAEYTTGYRPELRERHLSDLKDQQRFQRITSIRDRLSKVQRKKCLTPELHGKAYIHRRAGPPKEMDSRMIDSIVEMKMEEWRKLIYDPKLTPFENDSREMEDQMTRLEALVEKRTSKSGPLSPKNPQDLLSTPFHMAYSLHFNQTSKSTKMSSTTARLLPVRT